MFINKKDSIPAIFKAELYRVNEEHLSPKNGVIETLRLTGLDSSNMDHKVLATRFFGNPNWLALVTCRPNHVFDKGLALGLMRLNERIKIRRSTSEQDLLGTNLISVVVGQYFREQSLCDLGMEMFEDTMTYRPDILAQAIKEMRDGKIPYMNSSLVEEIADEAIQRDLRIRQMLLSSNRQNRKQKK